MFKTRGLEGNKPTGMHEGWGSRGGLLKGEGGSGGGQTAIDQQGLVLQKFILEATMFKTRGLEGDKPAGMHEGWGFRGGLLKVEGGSGGNNKPLTSKVWCFKGDFWRPGRGQTNRYA